MAKKELLCHGKDCYNFKIKYPRNQLIKYKNKNYCKDCYSKLNPVSETRNKIHIMIQRIFNLDEVPIFMELQINKYIREFNFTEKGIFNTLCYIYLEYDNKLKYEYGIYPVIQEYQLHNNYKFKKSGELKESPIRVVHTTLKPPTSNVIQKIKEVRLNDE